MPQAESKQPSQLRAESKLPLLPEKPTTKLENPTVLNVKDVDVPPGNQINLLSLGQNQESKLPLLPEKPTTKLENATWLNHEWDKKYSLTNYLMSSLCSYLHLKVSIYFYVMIPNQQEMITNEYFTIFPFLCSVPQQTYGIDCEVFVCRYAYALYQTRLTPITYVDLHLEKPPLKTAITQSYFFNFDDLQVTLLRTELRVLLDRLAYCMIGHPIIPLGFLTPYPFG